MKIVFKKILYIFLLFNYFNAFAQYPPAAGISGTTAIYKDSAVFIDWASYCEIFRGYINISDTTYEDPDFPGTNKASFGDSSSALGKADNNTVSLGDGGFAILKFNHPIANGSGFDFAVFENSFNDEFLELAFIEVSSDGVNFIRFPSVSLTQNTIQIPAFGTLETSKVYNLAGKYKVYYGTPFDLSDLQDSSGIDINHITHVKVKDVIGNISEPFRNYDSFGNIINDPFPTPYRTSGFDLDAVGVINNTTNTYIKNFSSENFVVFPNPANEYINISIKTRDSFLFRLINSESVVLKQSSLNNHNNLYVNDLKSGLYFIMILDKDKIVYKQKILIIH